MKKSYCMEKIVWRENSTTVRAIEGANFFQRNAFNLKLRNDEKKKKKAIKINSKNSNL